MKQLRSLIVMSLLMVLACVAPPVLAEDADESAASAEQENLATLPLRQWMAIGPLGWENLHERPEPVRGDRRVYADATYPMDEVIDLDAEYTGDITRHIDGETQTLTWQRVESEDDKGVVRFPTDEALPQNVGLTYASTWIKAPRDMKLTMLNKAYDGKGSWRRLGATAKVFLNGEALPRRRAHPDNRWIHHPHDKSTIALKKGWNHLYARVASTFAGIEIGYALEVDKEAVWDFTISATPPKEVGRVFKPSGEPIREDDAGEKQE